jgi:hypothetical protein
MTNPLIEPERARPAGRADDGQVRRARDAAEALFKPKAPSVADEAPLPAGLTAQAAETVPAPRRPRIIAVPPARPREDPVVTALTAPLSPLQPVRRARQPRVRKITASDHGRIRILATHGLTIEQVAELYDVSPGTIEKIIGDQ